MSLIRLLLVKKKKTSNHFRNHINERSSDDEDYFDGDND